MRSQKRKIGWQLLIPITFLLLHQPSMYGAEGTQWRPYLEWSLENATYSGSPYDLVAKVTFTHTSSGKQVTTEMFYDGNDTYKFRFTGTCVGTWHFETFSSDPELDGEVGTVTIQPNPDPRVHGFVTKFDGNKWGWHGTETAFVPQLAMYKSPRYLYDEPQVIEADIEEFLDEHGFDGFHVASIAGWWFDLDASDSRVTSSMTEPDRRTFEALEMLIAKTHAAGGLVHIWAWGDHSRHQTPRDLSGGINGAIDKRLQRYIAARLGPIPGWTMGYGFDLWEWVDGDQLTQWHEYMHEHLGWHHFLGARASKNELNQLSEAMDYSGYEQHRPDYDKYVETVEERPYKPSFSEDRFRIRNEGRAKDYNEEETRRGLWHSTMAGGVANIWGNLLENGGTRDSYRGTLPYPNEHQIKTYSVFFNDKGRFRKDMQRANELSGDGNTRVLRSGNTKYVFYRQDAGSIHMDLSDMAGPQPAVAVDTKAEYSQLDVGRLSPGEHTWDAPHSSDWAIAVGDWLLAESYNWPDLAAFAEQWLAQNCLAHDWCRAFDLNRSSNVDFADFAKVAENWLKPLPNRPPWVNITHPDDGASIHLPYEIQADAGDVDGSVLAVEFFADENRIGFDDNGDDGWTTDWRSGLSGIRTLTASATDNGGAVAVSLPVQVYVLARR